MKHNHTALPWRIHDKASTAVLGAESWTVASCGGHSDNTRGGDEVFEELQANAALIVKAVNNFYPLVDALTLAQEILLVNGLIVPQVAEALKSAESTTP